MTQKATFDFRAPAPIRGKWPETVLMANDQVWLTMSDWHYSDVTAQDYVRFADLLLPGWKDFSVAYHLGHGLYRWVCGSVRNPA